MARRKNISDQLRDAIRKSGLTHYRIAKDAGMKPEQISRFVAGERTVTLDTAARIAEVLRLELRWKK